MSQKTKRTYLFYLLSLPVIALVTTVLRTVALLRDYDAAIGYFTSPSLPTATVAILVAATAILALLTHELRELFVFSVDYKDLPSLFSGLFLAATLLFFSVSFVASSVSEAAIAIILAVLGAISAVIATASFAIHAFDGRAVGPARAMTTLPLAFLGILVALYFYFENSMRINEPNKVLIQCAWIAVAFFFLGETRIALARAKWALHTCITALTFLFTATAALPNLIYHAVRGESLLGNTVHDFVLLAICLYALARLFAAFASALRQSTPEMTYATDFAAAKTAAEAAADGQPTVTNEESDNEKATDR